MKIGFGLGISDYRLRGGLTFSPEALAWEADIIANGGTIDPLVLFTIDQNFIIPNVSGGNWTKFDRLHLWLTNSNSIAARTSMEGNNHFASFVNAVVFDDSGIKSDGVSAYVDLNFNPNTQGVNVTLNDVSIGYIVGAPPFTSTVRSIGCTNSTTTQRLEVYELASQSFAFINCQNFTANPNDVSTGNVLLAGKRSNSTDETAVINASEVTASDSSTGVPSANAYELTSHLGGTGPIGDYDTSYHKLSWHGSSSVNLSLLRTTLDNTETALAAL